MIQRFRPVTDPAARDSRGTKLLPARPIGAGGCGAVGGAGPLADTPSSAPPRNPQMFPPFAGRKKKKMDCAGRRVPHSGVLPKVCGCRGPYQEGKSQRSPLEETRHCFSTNPQGGHKVYGDGGSVAAKRPAGGRWAAAEGAAGWD